MKIFAEVLQHTAVFSLAIVGLVAAGAPPVAQDVDFSGYWALDVAASRVETADVLAGLGAGGAPENLFISQARDGSLILSGEHNPSISRAYRIGGETTLMAPGEQGGTMPARSVWQDGTLVVEGRVEVAAGTLRIRETLTLTDDDQTLVLEATTTTAAGVVSNRLVYRRWPPGRAGAAYRPRAATKR